MDELEFNFEKIVSINYFRFLFWLILHWLLKESEKFI
jgi:hypothetical protein